MPQLDVSFMTTDPMLADRFEVVRRRETIVDGRTTVTPVSLGMQTGVVTQESPSEIMKREDAQLVPRHIFVATMFQVYPAVEGYQPDEIVWNGTRYEAISVLPYSKYGRGVYEIIAEARKAMNNPQ